MNICRAAGKCSFFFSYVYFICSYRSLIDGLFENQSVEGICGFLVGALQDVAVDVECSGYIRVT